MLYMIVEHFRNGDPGPVYARFRASCRLAPAGLTYVNSWVTDDLRQCYQVMECDDPALLDEWLAAWADLVEFEVHPVVTSAQAAERVAMGTRVTGSFANVYDDPERAAAYATLDYPGTYGLAFRDLPEIIAKHVTGRRALDFGCGAGRSTRFLKRLGFDVVGVDIARHMVELAIEADPEGTYACVDNSRIPLEPGSLDLVLCAFSFDNIPGSQRSGILSDLGRLLRPAGRIILLGSTPEIYWHEWASFTTAAFPENRQARSGEPVRIVMKDVADSRPVIDLLWRHEDYLSQFAAARLDVLDIVRPLGRAEEPYAWISETSVPPWVIYVLAPGAAE